MATITLGYWGVKGVSQQLRYLMEFLGINYTQKLYSDPKEWFEKDKPSLKCDFPNLPYIIDGNYILTEHLAIVTYLI